jgi:flagellar biosynthesis anti-sigma factor FlgM
MAINPLFPNLARIYSASAPNARTGPDGDDQPSTAVKPSSTGDQVSVSPAARDLPRAVSAARSASELRLNRIENLRNQIAGGTYQVDLEKLASKLAKVLKP